MRKSEEHLDVLIFLLAQEQQKKLLHFHNVAPLYARSTMILASSKEVWNVITIIGCYHRSYNTRTACLCEKQLNAVMINGCLLTFPNRAVQLEVSYAL